jgi:hypothetical protein
MFGHTESKILKSTRYVAESVRVFLDAFSCTNPKMFVARESGNGTE